MTLPIRTTLDDVTDILAYFAKKPTGATIQEAKTVLDVKRLDGRKLAALKTWGLIEDGDAEKIKLTTKGRRAAKGADALKMVLLQIIRGIPAYAAIIERAAHRHEDSLDTIEVGVHWHEHFGDVAGDNETTLKDSAVCFFHIAAGAGLGTIVTGRKGNATRISFNTDALGAYIESSDTTPIEDESAAAGSSDTGAGTAVIDSSNPVGQQRMQSSGQELGQAIFVAHGKNKKPLEQLKKILEQFHIPYKVALDEPNLGRPISGKIKEVMHGCNCAILIFTADEEFRDNKDNVIWRPSENVVYELGASGYLYDNRIVILKEDTVSFPSNFSDIGYISFGHDQLEAKAMDVLKELIGFGIVKIST